jgi:hypothetical protein
MIANSRERSLEWACKRRARIYGTDIARRIRLCHTDHRHQLNVDFAYVSPAYCVVYVSGTDLCSTKGRTTSLTSPGDSLYVFFSRPKIDFLSTLTSPPITILLRSRKDEPSGPRGTFLRFGTMDDAPIMLHMLEGREGPRCASESAVAVGVWGA